MTAPPLRVTTSPLSCQDLAAHDGDSDGICDQVDPECEYLDECGVCDGSGPDAIGECGGNCQSDLNQDGICDNFISWRKAGAVQQPNWVAIIRDFDNDGLEDVMGYVNNQPQSLELHLSQGDLTFQDASTQLEAPADTLLNSRTQWTSTKTVC